MRGTYIGNISVRGIFIQDVWVEDIYVYITGIVKHLTMHLQSF